MNKTIWYIGGAGRSGSTVLDITLGNKSGVFSLGELIFFMEHGIQNGEYCSCGSIALNCSFWSRVYELWSKKKRLSDKQFVTTQNRLIKNRYFIVNFFRKPENYLEYLEDLQLLYSIIFEVSECETIVDSSKNGSYIKLLKKLPFNLEVIHLKKPFSERFISTSKAHKKNSSKGIERDFRKSSIFYSMATWLFDNFLVRLNARNVKLHKLQYSKFIKNPEAELSYFWKGDMAFKKLLLKRGPLSAKHLIAGNRMRMENDIFIKRTTNKTYGNNIRGWEILVCRVVDFVF